MENTQNTTVAYKDATPEEQAARRAAQQERYIEMGVQAGLQAGLETILLTAANGN